jgi:hypothetical protein
VDDEDPHAGRAGGNLLNQRLGVSPSRAP